MDTYSALPNAPQAINSYTAHWLTRQRLGQLLLVKTLDQQHKTITELITQWVLRGPVYLIAAGEWMPQHDELRYSVYKHTVAFDEALERLILSRPFTCLQLLDLLIEADQQNNPVLILDFLHLFYNPDVDLALRHSTLEQCCQYVKRLSFSNPVAVLVPDLAVEEYRRFYPLIASIANEIIEQKNPSPAEVFQQGVLF
jgi:hypothetical protein